jgi:putative Ca2+/H+ antiporter (TMEM165/GDT1 family)
MLAADVVRFRFGKVDGSACDRRATMESWWATFLSTYAVVFLAELGDKTQLAVLGLSSSRKHTVAVLVGSVLALITSTVVAVALGVVLKVQLNPRLIRYAAGGLFVILGAVLLLTAGSAGGAPKP